MSALATALAKHKTFVGAIDDAVFLRRLRTLPCNVVPFKRELERRALDKGIAANFKRLSIQNMKDIFEAIDDIYFDGRLGRKTAVSFKFTRRGAKKGGHCDPVAPGKIEIAVNGYLILRSKGTEKVNGLQCHSRLMTLIEILLHESVHGLVFTYGTGRERPHGKEFRGIALSLFGHLDIKHFIKQDVPNMISKSEARVGQVVAFKTKKSCRKEGRIKSLNLKTATVILVGTERKCLVPYEYLQPVAE